MADLFKEKSEDWDGNDRRRNLAAAIGRAVKSQITLTADMEVLDFGAGTGLLCSQIAPEVKKIVAADISESMLEKLSAKEALKAKVEIINQDIITHPLAMKFDLIMSAMTLHHVEDTDHLIAVLKANLKPGGHIALADLDAEDGTFHPKDAEGIFHHGFDRDDLAAKMTQAGFTNISFVTAHSIQQDERARAYPVFLMTAKRD
ncbi:MAG: class I SAM-dependent methyltransferase [Alphaproteobacteria bacterium]|nr:class I SAM-dependent methyltransferase [Alphaproteobacteria bacterium]